MHTAAGRAAPPGCSGAPRPPGSGGPGAAGRGVVARGGWGSSAPLTTCWGLVRGRGGRQGMSPPAEDKIN